jgi:GIY-YIG catalytic domain
MFTVYALIDPRTSAVRYVGLTEKPLAERLRNHLCRPGITAATRHGAWLRELRGDGVKPQIVALEQVPHGEYAYDAEGYWIRSFLDRGADLTNTVRQGRPRGALLRTG